MKKLILILVMVVTGCASQATPEQRKLAAERKGQQHKIDVALTPEDNISRKCGHLPYYRQYECSQNVLRSKIQEQARDYCVFYGPYDIRWEITRGASFNRATRASTTITCLGTREQTGS